MDKFRRFSSLKLKDQKWKFPPQNCQLSNPPKLKKPLKMDKYRPEKTEMYG